MRRSTKVALTVAVLCVVGSAPAWAGATDSGPTTPDGLGGLFTVPTLAGDNGQSLFEEVSPNRYGIYSDLGITDADEKFAAVLYEPMQLLGMLLVRLAVALTWWLQSLTDQDTGVGTLAAGLGDVSATLNEWLLPTALGIGVVLSYAAARRGDDALSQLGWTLAAAVACVAMATGAGQIVGGLNTGRQLIASTVSEIGADQVNPAEVPFAWPGADFDTDDPSRDLARKSGDAVWRSFAVVPWCQAEFGSQEACERYGAEWLALQDDEAKREFIKNVVGPTEGSDEAPTVRYLQGHNPADRLVVSLFTLINGAGVAMVLGGLSLMALMPWITAVVFMFLAVVFLALLVIPGRPRGLALDFLNLIGGLTLLSALTTGILSGAMLATTAATSIAETRGWLASALMTTAILVAAWAGRRTLEQLLLSGGGGRAAGAAGAAALVFGWSAGRRLLRTVRRSTRSSGRTASGGQGEGSDAGGRGGAGTAVAGRPGGRGGGPRFAYFTPRRPAPGTSAGGEGRPGSTTAPGPAGRSTAATGPGGRPLNSGPGRHPRGIDTRTDRERARDRLAGRPGPAGSRPSSTSSTSGSPASGARGSEPAPPRRFVDYEKQARQRAAAPRPDGKPRHSEQRRRQDGEAS